jgi:hypothetical protein
MVSYLTCRDMTLCCFGAGHVPSGLATGKSMDQLSLQGTAKPDTSRTLSPHPDDSAGTVERCYMVRLEGDDFYKISIIRPDLGTRSEYRYVFFSLYSVIRHACYDDSGVDGGVPSQDTPPNSHSIVSSEKSLTFPILCQDK